MSPTLLRAVSAGALLAAMAMLAAQPSFAQHQKKATGSTNSNSPMSTDRATGLDRAQDRYHPSTRTNTNTNGVNAADRQTGFDRATDRMSQQGLTNNQVGTAGTAGGGKGRR